MTSVMLRSALNPRDVITKQEIEKAKEFFLYASDDTIAETIEDLRGLTPGEITVEIDTGHDRKGFMTCGGIYANGKKVDNDEMLAIAERMNIKRWLGPSRFQIAEKRVSFW